MAQHEEVAAAAATKQRRYELAMILHPEPRNRSIRPTLWQTMSKREKIREVGALVIVAVAVAVMIATWAVLVTPSGRSWLAR